jgi:hypothetical protein
MATPLLLILAFAIITGYVIMTACKHKALKSISDSEYWLSYPWKWVFEAVMWSCGLLLMATAVHITKDPQWLIFAGGCGVFGVGVFARFKKNLFYKIAHYTCAVIGFGSLAFSFIPLGYWYWTIVVALSAALCFVFSKRDNPGIMVWNTELFLIYSTFIGFGLVLSGL